ncbi:MAG: hypothetical protein HS111_34755 [Kofleriaceae bacterium]|nr:hypothetical protein [Kofleriaceae bacterium]
MRTRFAIDAALGWRIRRPRGDHRGRVHVVPDPHGHPLVLPLSTTSGELRAIIVPSRPAASDAAHAVMPEIDTRDLRLTAGRHDLLPMKK